MKKLSVQFYEPIISFSRRGVPIVVYPSLGIEHVLERSAEAAVGHVHQLFERHPLKDQCEYAVVILWAHDGKVGVDVWEFSQTETWGSGPLADVHVFSGMQQLLDSGVSAGDGLMLLGEEERLRRSCSSTKDYWAACPRSRHFLTISLQGEYCAV